MKRKYMSIPTFLRRLAAWHKKHPRIGWTIADGRYITTDYRGKSRERACPITAIAWSRPRSGTFFRQGADALNLSLYDGRAIVDAADARPNCDLGLRTAILKAVGLA